MGPRLYFEIPFDWTRKELAFHLQKEFAVQFMAIQRGMLRYYDSFDWRLHFSQIMLIWDGVRLFLVQTNPRYSEITCPYDQEPKFVQDLPEGALRQKLYSIIEFRALLPVIALKKEAQPVKFLNQEDKTVCYGFYEKNSVIHGQILKRLRPVFCLVPLKGYFKWADHLTEWLQINGCHQIESDIYYRALQKVRIIPGHYTSKEVGQISGEINVRQATRMILKQQLSISEINEDGIQKDIDTEFLHDFRVAIRRMRSLFGNLQDYVDESVYGRAKTDFTDLIKLTNSRRDLDIFLHRQPVYLQLLPPRYRTAVSPFFADLKSRREKEQKKIVRFLISEKYKDMKLYWYSLAQNKSAQFGVAGRTSVKIQAVAQKIILKRYEKIVGLNQDLPSVLSDEFLHQVRIECKKLRYVLEFFQSLFNLKPVKNWIKKLRILQDTLGEYNDLRLQQYRLNAYIQNLIRRGDTVANMVRALNFLLTKLHGRKNDLQPIFREQFADFCEPARQQNIREIFQGTKNS